MTTDEKDLARAVEALADEWDGACASRCLPRNGKPNNAHDCGLTKQDAAARLTELLAAHRPDRATQPTAGARTVETDEREALAALVFRHTTASRAESREAADAVLARFTVARRAPARADL